MRGPRQLAVVVICVVARPVVGSELSDLSGVVVRPAVIGERRRALVVIEVGQKRAASPLSFTLYRLSSPFIVLIVRRRFDVCHQCQNENSFAVSTVTVIIRLIHATV